MSSHTVARVAESDLDLLLPLMRAYCEFYEVAPGDGDLLALARALVRDPAHEGMQLLARDTDGRAVGFATVYWSWSTTDAARIGVMNDLYVVDSARGQGVAEALIAGCRSACADHGARRMSWQTAADNHRAQAVYERVGAVREQWVDYWLPV